MGYVEDRPAGVHMKKGIAGRVSQNKTCALSLSFSPLSLSFFSFFPSLFFLIFPFFSVFSVARPTFLCLQVTL